MFGTALASLGLLDIGSRNIDVLAKDQVTGTNPMYSKLLHNQLPLVVLDWVYLFVYFGTLGVLYLVDRRKGDGGEEEGEEDTHA